MALEPEHVPVARSIDAPVDDNRQGDPLSGGNRVVRLLLKAFRQGVHRKRHAVRNPVLLAHRKRMDTWFVIRRSERGHREIPAFEFHGRLGAGWAAQREDARYIWQLT